MSETKRPVIIIDGKWRPYWQAILGYKAGLTQAEHMMFRNPKQDEFYAELYHADGRKERFTRRNMTMEARHTDRRQDEDNRWVLYFTGQKAGSPDLVAYDDGFSSVSWHAKQGSLLCVPPTNRMEGQA